MDLIWMDGAVHVAGPDTRAFLVTLGPGQVVIGLRFRPGTAPVVLGIPAWALRDRRVRLEDLWPGTTVTQQVAEAPDPAVALAAAVASRVTEPDLALRAVLAHVRAGSSVAATAVQAHLAREARALAGVPLGQLVRAQRADSAGHAGEGGE